MTAGGDLAFHAGLPKNTSVHTMPVDVPPLEAMAERWFGFVRQLTR